MLFLHAGGKLWNRVACTKGTKCVIYQFCENCCSSLNCQFLNFLNADNIPCVSVKGIGRNFIEKANPGVIDKARMLLELIFVRNGSLQVN